jgi:Uma2 family endonuclease
MQKASRMSDAARLVTAEEFERYPDDNYRYELVEGHVVRMNPPGSRHGHLASNISALLSGHVKKHGLGVVMVESGFTLARNPDTVRGPDVSVVRRERIPPPGLPHGFWQGAPDLAVEVLSPGNRGRALRTKISDYLAKGVIVVVVIDPDKENVTVHRRLAAPRTLGSGDELNLEDVIENFRCPVGEIFATAFSPVEASVMSPASSSR